MGFELLSKKEQKVIKVVQNPYWYGFDEETVKYFEKRNIKCETYKTLGHGILPKKGFSPSFLANESIKKGFYPILKASTDEHLKALAQEPVAPADYIKLLDKDHVRILTAEN